MSTVLTSLLYHIDAFVLNIDFLYYNMLMQLLYKTCPLTFVNYFIFTVLILP